MKIDLFGSSGQAWSDAVSAIECINMIPEKGADKSSMIFRSSPGSAQLLEISADSNDEIVDIYGVSASVRYSDFDARLYVIWYDDSQAVGSKYQLNVIYWNGSAVTHANIGTLTGASGSFTNMVHDATKQGGKTVFADREANTLWYITMNNTATSDTRTSYTLPTGWEFQSMTYQDGFFFAVVKDSGTNEERRKVVHSDFGTHTFTSTTFYTRTSAPGNILAVLSDNREVWVFCEDGIEVLYNAGKSGFAFARNNSVFIEVGLLSENTIVKFHDTIMFLGAPLEGQIGIYKMNGYTPVDISPPEFIERIGDLKGAGLEAAFAHPIKTKHNNMYVLNMEVSNVGAWAYDLKHESWSQPVFSFGTWPFSRGYAFADLEVSPSQKAGYNFLVNTSSVSAAGVVTNSFNISYLVSNAGTYYHQPGDSTAALSKVLISRHIYGEDNDSLRHDEVQIECEPNGAGISLALDYSDDDGSNWTSAGIVTATDGIFQWRALGASPDRIYKIQCDDSQPLLVISAWLKAEQLDS